MNQKAMPIGRQGFSQLILLVIAGLVILGGGAWYYQQPSAQNKPATDMQTISTATQSSSVSVVPEPSADNTSPALVEQEQQANKKTSSITPTQNTVPKTPAQTTGSTKQVTAPADVAPPAPSTPEISCTSPTDTRHMDIFDSHAHNIIPKFSLSQMIAEMNKAGVSVTNLYSGTLDIASQYPGRFITFVDTPDSPQPSTWLAQGQAFVTSAEAMLKTGKYYGIGETNLRYWGGKGSAPTLQINVSSDNPIWLQLMNLSAQYHVPISFHFVPDDTVANAAFERMLSSNKNATFIWAHLGFNGHPLNRTTLSDYLLRYPNLYFDTAGIQNMQNPLPMDNSNWARLMPNGRLDKDWKQFFETWNSRILFGSDAGGGGNGLERWLNYSSNASDGAPADAIGHWKSLFSYTDQNTARNILSANARELFLKDQKKPYNYSVSSGGKCYTISVRSESSVSALTFNPSTRTIAFTVANSNDTTGNAVITIPIAFGTNFTASVDGKRVKSQSTSNSTDTTISLEYSGGIKLITLNATE
ncbi:MAG: amidohydrolase family protein [bacterium]|nr:amidohydrolase family protein [bacterium]